MQYLINKKFEKSFKKLTDKHVIKDIAETIENIEQAKNITDIKDCKKLKGYKTAFRIKIGDYRIGIVYTDNTIFIIDLDHRKDIYKNFP